MSGMRFLMGCDWVLIKQPVRFRRYLGARTESAGGCRAEALCSSPQHAPVLEKIAGRDIERGFPDLEPLPPARNNTAPPRAARRGRSSYGS